MASQVQFPKAEPTVDELLRLDPFEQPETPKEKLVRKLKEQPLVPLGCLLTIGALTVASKHLRSGNRDAFNRALRWRVGFQGLTVVAAMAGTYYFGHSSAAAAPSAGEPASAPVATLPGRPATTLQQNRADERREAEREAWLERVREAERREKKEREDVEAALLRGDAQKGRTAWPTIGQDSRRS